MVTKEPKEYYWLRGEYLFRNLITGREALLCDYSRPTTHKCQGKELEILREQMIDRCLKRLAFVLRNNKKECISQYVLVEIIKEEWQKL